MILTFGGAGGRDPIRHYASGGFRVYLGGFQVALGAIDVLRRQLAAELGPHGIRVVTLQSGGVPETTGEDWREAITQSFVETSMLKRAETLEDVGTVCGLRRLGFAPHHDGDGYQHHRRPRRRLAAAGRRRWLTFGDR